MPYPNEHASRQNDPGKYKKFRRQNDKFGSGIDAIFGITDDGKAEIQAIRFDSKKFTPQQAKAWLKEHDYKTTLEAASSKSAEGFDIPSSNILKLDEEQRLVFGWFSVIEQDGIPIVDKQDDIIEESELEKAAYDFVLNARIAGDRHVRKGIGRLVSSIVFTKEMQGLLGINLGKVGWFGGFKIDDDDVWNAIKSGNYLAFSIGGRGQRMEVD